MIICRTRDIPSFEVWKGSGGSGGITGDGGTEFIDGGTKV